MARHGVAGGSLEGKIFGVSLAELEIGVAPAGIGQHGRRKIKAGNSRAPLRRGASEFARPARGVEETDIGPGVHPAEYRLVRLCCKTPE